MIDTLRRAVVGFAMVAAVAVGVSALFFPLSSRIIDPKRGESLFRRRCASCHSLDDAATPRYGPALNNIGAQAESRVRGVGAEEYIFTSITQPGAYQTPGTTGEMPETIAQGMTCDDLLSLIAFLCGQGGRFRAATLLDLVEVQASTTDTATPARSLDLASVERGRRLFLGELNCSQCHSLYAVPGGDLIAPSLRAIGYHDRTYLEDAILHASRRITPGYETWYIDQRGVLQSGRRLPALAGSVTLLTRNDRAGIKVRSFSDQELEPLEDGELAKQAATSLMPDFNEAISRDDLTALIDFLTTLR